MKNALVAAAVVLGLPVAQASAAQILYEPFDYTAGSVIAGQTNTYSPGNPQWFAAGTAHATTRHQVVSGSLTPPTGLAAAVGNSGATMNVDNTEYHRITLGGEYGTNTTLYYSLLLNIPSISGLTTANTNGNANNNGIIAFNNTPGASGTRPSAWAGELVIRLGSVENTYNLGIRASTTPTAGNPGATYWTGDIAPGSASHFVVVRYTQGATEGSGADNLNSIWINPNPDSFGASELAAPAPDGSSQGSISNNATNNTDFARTVILGAGIANGTTPTQNNVDEIRVGTTWADVTVPEPGSFGLLALGAIGFLKRRSRRA